MIPSSGALHPVLHLTAAFPAPSDPVRGQFVEHFVNALARAGHPGLVVAPRVQPGDPGVEERDGLEVRRFRYPGGGRRLKELGRPSLPVLAGYLYRGLRETIRAVRERDPAVIYAHWVLPTGLIGAVASWRTGRPLVLHAHGSDIHRYALASPLARRLARWTLARSSGVLAVSRDLLELMERELGLERGKGRVVPMGLPADRFTPEGRDDARAQLELDDSRLELLYVGDLDPAKGIVALAAAMSHSATLRERARLHVVGEGQDGTRLEEIAAEGVPGWLRLHGRRPPGDVARWMRAADALVLPSRGEGCPLVVLEALRSALPVLGTPVGALPDLLGEGSRGTCLPAEAFVPRLESWARESDELSRMRAHLLEEAGSLDLDVESRAREVSAYLAEMLADANEPAPEREPRGASIP